MENRTIIPVGLVYVGKIKPRLQLSPTHVSAQEADITPGPLLTTTSRAEAADPSYPVAYADVVIFAGRPFEFSKNVFGFLDALSPLVWLATTMAFLATWAAYVGTSLASAAATPPHGVYRSQLSIRRHGNVLRSFEMLLSSLLSQGSSHVPEAVSQRNLAAVWFLCLIVLRTSFLAQTKASLVVQDDVRIIEGIEDLAKDDRITPVVIQGSGFFWLLEGEAAMIFTPDPVYGVLKDLCGKLGTMNGEFYYAPKVMAQLPLSMFTNKRLDPSLRSSIDKKIVLFIERGLVHKLHRDSGYEGAPCRRESALHEQKARSSSQMERLQGIFILWLSGIVISALVLAAEHLHQHWSATTATLHAASRSLRMSRARLFRVKKLPKMTPSTRVLKG
ncbi:hypothetical protein HPB48_013917 [Haemaphysalis longicornis]|uniref:Ionotropic glutamate receptor C-terminal domain-containing protein n=1 Tax=Haemaphysalis longicornis TaxID=44386 RepID=A0A9J6G5V0_HAELO|nr:hypothetical protein HPB48_013917 [Haemaphysalis longicornis]